LPEAVEVPQSAAPTPKANASPPPAAVEVPPSAEFTFVASREPTQILAAFYLLRVGVAGSVFAAAALCVGLIEGMSKVFS
jgi:hypothetical protein